MTSRQYHSEAERVAAQQRAAIDNANAQAQAQVAAEAQKQADRAALAEEAKRLSGKGRKR